MEYYRQDGCDDGLETSHTLKLRPNINKIKIIRKICHRGLVCGLNYIIQHNS